MKHAVSAVLLAKSTCRVALVRRTKEPRKDEWSLPGGSVEPGESLEDALARELREELGVDLSAMIATGVISAAPRAVARVRVADYEIAVFLCETNDEPALTPASDAGDATWASPADCRTRGLAEDTARVVDDACSESEHFRNYRRLALQT